MAKTLVDFRAEKGLYLKDLAAETGIPEDELRAIEQSGTVPEELGQRIIAQYALPADYFAEPVKQEKVKVKIIKKTPEKPLIYFLGVSFVWALLVGFVAAFPNFLRSMVLMMVSLFSVMTDNDSSSAISSSPIFDIFDSIFTSAVIVFSGIILSNYIVKHTTFEGNIKKYRFLYYTWPNAAVSFVVSIATLISSTVLLNQSTTDPLASSGITIAVSSIVSLISFGVVLLAAYVRARLLNAAALGDEDSQKKELRLLAICVTVSTVISIGCYIAKVILNNLVEPISITMNIIIYLIAIAVIWIAATVKPQNEKQEKVIFTVLPIIAMCDSVVYTIISVLIG